MSAGSAPLGYGLYFIDVLACLLFCLTLALVGARFGSEQTVPIDLPRMERVPGSGTDVTAPSIALRREAGEVQVFLQGKRVTLPQLEEVLKQLPPPSVIVRAEESALVRVIGIVHAAGVQDIQLAYEVARPEGDSP